MNMWIVLPIVTIFVKIRDPLIEIMDDIIGTTLFIGLDVYKKGKEYLHERKKICTLRGVQGDWSTSTSAAARRAQRRRKPLP
jgi:hypothetical protein